jgi:hypothetical protein
MDIISEIPVGTKCVKEDKDKKLYKHEYMDGQNYRYSYGLRNSSNYQLYRYSSKVTDRYVDFLPVVASFYVLEALSLLEKPSRRVDYRKFASWRKTLLEFQTNYINDCARSLRDCLTALVMAEARYSLSKTRYNKIRTALIFGDFGNCVEKSRLYIYSRCIFFHPDQIPQLKELFNNHMWIDEYGGSSWGNICKKIELYGKTSNKLYCDSVFNSVHNDGIAFNKQFMFHTANRGTLEFLHYRSFADNILTTPSLSPIPIHYNVFNLFLSACKMKLIDCFWYEDSDEDSLYPAFIENFISTGSFKFKKIEWKNTQTLSLKRFRNILDEPCDDDEFDLFDWEEIE